MLAFFVVCQNHVWSLICDTISLSKDNAAAVKLELQLRSKLEFASWTVPLQWGKEEAPEAYCTYAEEADDAANKVSQRKRIGIIHPLKLARSSL